MVFIDIKSSYEPEFEDLAEELKGNSNLVLAQIDLSNNDLDVVKIENYPGYKLYKTKVSSNPVNFE
jgi:protein disulfide-isomerase A1